MLIDCYGNPSTSEFYQRRRSHFAESVQSGAFTYIRYGTEETGPVHRLDETDAANPKLRWAFGAWADRESLNYVNDLNTPLNVEGE